MTQQRECEVRHGGTPPSEKPIPLGQVKLIEIETGRVVVPQIIPAKTIVQRTFGLIGKRELSIDSGLWLEPCNGIHTFGMRFAIDVVAFDAAGTVLKTWEAVRPFRICLPVAKGRTVLELPAGTLAQLKFQCDKHYCLEPNDPIAQ